jgi:hypothetical protein
VDYKQITALLGYPASIILDKTTHSSQCKANPFIKKFLPGDLTQPQDHITWYHPGYKGWLEYTRGHPQPAISMSGALNWISVKHLAEPLWPRDELQRFHTVNILWDSIKVPIGATRKFQSWQFNEDNEWFPPCPGILMFMFQQPILQPSRWSPSWRTSKDWTFSATAYKPHCW